MAALTLAMLELADINAEEFFNIRNYYNCLNSNIDARIMRNNRGGRVSPTSSESSGISSLASCASSDRDSIDLNNIPGRKITRTSTPEIIQEDKTVKNEAKNLNVQIIHEGRDVLNLLGNLRQSTWQTKTSSFSTNNYNNNNQNGYLRLYRRPSCETPTDLCKDCGFCIF